MYSDFTLSWHKEDDGTYTKMKVMWKDPRSGRIKQIVVLEDNVSKEEYFKRKLANAL